MQRNFTFAHESNIDGYTQKLHQICKKWNFNNFYFAVEKWKVNKIHLFNTRCIKWDIIIGMDIFNIISSVYMHICTCLHHPRRMHTCMLTHLWFCKHWRVILSTITYDSVNIYMLVRQQALVMHHPYTGMHAQECEGYFFRTWCMYWSTFTKGRQAMMKKHFSLIEFPKGRQAILQKPFSRQSDVATLTVVWSTKFSDHEFIQCLH